MMRTSSRAGVTLLELVVSLAIIGMGSAVASLAWRRQEPSDSGSAVARLATDARRRAIASGRVQRVAFRRTADGAVLDADDAMAGSVVRHLVAFPDGTVIADSVLQLDLLDGQARVTPERAR